ncbi:FtsK/SpoIIIE family DNA translocase [Halothermothrix orenii]|uniref:Cell divisionFtsK/SpoIIIE n=1 Tax=Halothermothrix orenii (strain H 168 / OCM 544 / DSM 9562) TaxID=373903 RepID=B8CWG3_HALOH|nr:DNA translocase FtsK [Halothermothrix orenii]ACL69632.1 cell divisionFtsK/SpoIIIE [Halothermothrix orenii H 168]
MTRELNNEKPIKDEDKNNVSENKVEDKSPDEEIREKRKNEILGILITALGVLSGLSIFTGTTGVVGTVLADFYRNSTGIGSYLIPCLLIVWGITLIRLKSLALNSRIGGFLLTYIISLGIIHNYLYGNFPLEYAKMGEGGGWIGGGLTWVCNTLFGYIGAYVILTAFLLIGILLWADVLLVSILDRLKFLIRKPWEKIRNILKRKRVNEVDGNELDDNEFEQDAFDSFIEEEIYPDEDTLPEEDMLASEVDKDNRGKLDVNVDEKSDTTEEDRAKKGNGSNSSSSKSHVYKLPGINLLKKSNKKRNKPGNKSDLLEETLESFGVKAKVLGVNHGPTITRYEVQPASGVKVSKIVGLANDIALALAAPDVRIEAPIPGKSAVGIEVPHMSNKLVRLRDIINTRKFKNSKSKLSLALGMGIDGQPIITDLSRMPHLLVAGATGSGKSVCMNTIITSILFKATPDEVKLMLIDPKKVELSIYKDLPHLFAPVVTDPRKAASVLKLVIEEMERRYELFSQSGTRGITSYNKTVAPGEKLPYIVVVIDELSDLMMVSAREVEDNICRLAQMARAAGIHLVIATQRPSVDVITGLIKANIPSRISFAVSSQTDSRTILDMGGAEKLLGKGDMLFAPAGSQKPQRIQGAFIDNDEIRRVVSYVKNQADPDYKVELDDIKEVQLSVNDEKDELYEEAVRLVVKYRASISMLQRKLHIGHSRAARLIDMMEEDGIVGPYAGSKPREVLINEDDLEEILNNGQTDDKS